MISLTAFKLITFQLSRDTLLSLNKKHLALGLLCTWIVGIGRYWDHPTASIIQHLGLGSVVYIFILTALLWLVILPIKPKSVSYLNLITFISLTSIPGIIYAIPVERYFNLETANQINASFLAIVAIWRVALFIFYLRKVTQISPYATVIVTFLPLNLIVFPLFLLNLEQAVFEIMGGITKGTANDAAYAILFILSYFSFYAFIPLVILYVILIYLTRKHHVSK